MYRIRLVIPCLLLVVALAGWTAFVLLGRVSGFDVSWWDPKAGSVPPDDRGDLVRDSLTVIALFGAALAAVYAYRKQRLDEAASHRADGEGLSRRYQDSAEQLGHAKAAVRLAGVYSMARLADQWPEQSQTCVDVLCAYLRMPATGADDPGDIEVRQSIHRVIGQHTMDGRWSHLRFDFTGADLRDVDFRGSRFTTWAEFDRVRFSGQTKIAAEFNGYVSFDDCVFTDQVYLAVKADILTLKEVEIADESDVAMILQSVRGAHLFNPAVNGRLRCVMRNASGRSGDLKVTGLKVRDRARFEVEAQDPEGTGPVTGPAPVFTGSLWWVSDEASLDIESDLFDTGRVKLSTLWLCDETTVTFRDRLTVDTRQIGPPPEQARLYNLANPAPPVE